MAEPAHIWRTCHARGGTGRFSRSPACRLARLLACANKHACAGKQTGPELVICHWSFIIPVRAEPEPAPPTGCGARGGAVLGRSCTTGPAGSWMYLLLWMVLTCGGDPTRTPRYPPRNRTPLAQSAEGRATTGWGWSVRAWRGRQPGIGPRAWRGLRPQPKAKSAGGHTSVETAQPSHASRLPAEPGCIQRQAEKKSKP